MNPKIMFCWVLAVGLAGRLAGQSVPSSAPTNALQLPQVVAEVLSNNPSIKAARANWEAMKERVPQARAWEDPKLGFDSTVKRFVDQPPNAMTDQKLMAEQMLPISGKNLLRGQAAGAEALAAFEEYRRRELDAVADARAAYYRLGTAFTQLDLNRRNTALLQQIVEITRAKYEAGTHSQADLLGAQSELARIEEAAVDVQRDLSEAQSRLNVLMHRPARAPLEHPVTPAFVPPNLPVESPETMAFAHRPEIIMAERNLEAAQARLKAARREWIPEPGLRVEGDRYNAAAQVISEVGVGFTIGLPWFNHSKYEAGIRENQKMVERAKLELESIRFETLGMVRDQLKKVETYQHHTELFAGKLLPLAQQAVAAKRLGYETDKASFLELISAQKEAQAMESMYWDHLMHYQMALAELEGMLGANPMTAPPMTEHPHNDK